MAASEILDQSTPVSHGLFRVPDRFCKSMTEQTISILQFIAPKLNGDKGCSLPRKIQRRARPAHSCDRMRVSFVRSGMMERRSAENVARCPSFLGTSGSMEITSNQDRPDQLSHEGLPRPIAHLDIPLSRITTQRCTGKEKPLRATLVRYKAMNSRYCTC